MAVSAFDLFSIGIGPSSSHTVGPMRAARRFAEQLAADGLLDRTTRIKAQLYGSLGATGHGHGSDKAVLWGLEGEDPETIDTRLGPFRIAEIAESARIRLNGTHQIDIHLDNDVILHRRLRLPYHPNGMTFAAYDSAGDLVRESTYYSIGGGFIVAADAEGHPVLVPDPTPVPYDFRTGDELLAHCAATGLRISDVMLANECARRPEAEVRAGLLRIWSVMAECVRNGCGTVGVLPGGLKVRRRASGLYARLSTSEQMDPLQVRELSDPMQAVDWVTVWALAVNEENASGGRVVTAPTNGAAGIIPAVLYYALHFAPGMESATQEDRDDVVVKFLLTAGAIGVLYKEQASISGAEVGCQGEVGSASSMAAAGLAEVMGGTPAQVENAAEIAMEHNLGLTCDPIGGLVQVPCIERNAIAAAKAINAAKMALWGDGSHRVSLDEVIVTMRETGKDISSKYKETAMGGLAVNVVEC